MADSIFSHKDCGGNLFLDLSKLISFRTPSIGISSEGLSIGVTELQYNPKAPIEFTCNKCGKGVSIKSLSEILVECSICGESKPCSSVMNNYNITSFCSDCEDELTGKKPRSEKIARISKYLVLPSEMKSTAFSEILSKKLSI